MSGSVLVVGAGSAGLAAAAALQARGLVPLVLDRGEGVGAAWRSRHAELRLNTVRGWSDLPAPRMPRRLGRWVRRDDFVRYLQTYADAHRLNVRSHTEVRSLAHRDGGWTLDTSAGSLVADHVVLATGRESEPWTPSWPGAATAAMAVRHVSSVRSATDFAGRRVLVVGAGNSGVEMAGHLVDAGAAAAWVSVRTPPFLLPREVGGVPLQPLTAVLRPLPERARDVVARALSRAVYGDLRPYGLHRPPIGPYERLRTTGVTVAVDQGFVAHVVAGRIGVVAPVAEFDGRNAVLVDGRVLQPDVILAATGFRCGLEPLAADHRSLDARGCPAVPDPADGADGLWFAGFRTGLDGTLRHHWTDARRIARGIARATPYEASTIRRTHAGHH